MIIDCRNNNGLSGVGESKLNDLGLGNEMNCNMWSNEGGISEEGRWLCVE